MLGEVGIEKVFTITVDNASANNSAIAYLKKRLKSWGGLVLDGEFMHMRCAHAHAFCCSHLKEAVEKLGWPSS